MGNRMLRESLLESEKISGLTDFDFRLWVSLILLADDYGVVDARPAIIKGHGFPLRDRVTIKDISDGLRRLTAGRCVSFYTVGGKPYVQFLNWSDHQRVRDSKHKFPTIEEADTDSCGELRQPAANRGELRPELELELELEHRTKTPQNNAESERFNDFWSVYPKKVKKPDAMKIWKSGNLDKIADAIIEDVQKRRETEWSGQDMRYVPHPTTYLHQRRWEDETPPQERKGRTGWHNPALDYQQRGSDGKVDESGVQYWTEEQYEELARLCGTEDSQ